MELIRWFSRYCITDSGSAEADSQVNDVGNIIALDKVLPPIEMPYSASINGAGLKQPLTSPTTKKHADYLDERNILQEIEDSFRPATDEVD